MTKTFEDEFTSILVYQPAAASVSSGLRLCQRLACKIGSAVTVVDVDHDDEAWWNDMQWRDSSLGDFDNVDKLVDLNALTDELDFPTGLLHVRLLKGRPIDALVNRCTQGNHDLLVKTIDTNTNNLFLGSLDMRLLRMSPVPVLLVHPEGPTKQKRILVAIDPAAADEQQMNQRVLSVAKQFADRDSAELFVVSVWRAPPPAVEEKLLRFDSYQNIKKRVKKESAKCVDRVLQDCGFDTTGISVIYERGRPSDGIVRAASDVQPDLLVMGSVAKKGVPGLLIGNTAEEVSRQISCSLLTLKPREFFFEFPASMNVAQAVIRTP